MYKSLLELVCLGICIKTTTYVLTVSYKCLSPRVRMVLRKKAFKCAAPGENLKSSELLVMEEFESILKDHGNSSFGQCCYCLLHMIWMFVFTSLY